MASSPITPWQIEGEKVEVVTNLFLLGSEVTADGDCSHETRKYLLLGRKARQCAEKQRHYSADESPYSQGCGLPSGHAQLWELDCKEDGALKNQCLPTVVLEKTPESPLDSKEIKPVNLKGNQPWVLNGRTDAEVETPVFWSFDVNSWLIGKVPDAGKDRGLKEKRASEDEMAGWHHQCNGHELRQTSGDGDGQRGLACCSPCVCKQSDTTGWLNKNKVLLQIYF